MVRLRKFYLTDIVCVFIFTFAIKFEKMNSVNSSLKSYIEKEILPRYENFDKAHRLDHVTTVIAESLNIARNYPETDVNMVYAVAAYHDTGLVNGRDNHHIDSGKIIMADENLRRWFTDGQLQIMRDAAEDHRASSDHEPRTIYGKIVAEADRIIDTDIVIHRTVQYSLKHFPDYTEEQHYQRVCDHLKEKYLEGGYLKLWIPESKNAARLRELREMAKDKTRLRAYFDKYFQMETKS